MNPPDHTKYIVAWVGVLCLCAMTVGGALLYKGFQGGELLVGAATTGIGGLLGAMQPRRNSATGDALAGAEVTSATIRMQPVIKPA